MIASGTKLFWLETDYSGNVVRAHQVVTVGDVFTIKRNCDGEDIPTCRLSNNRLAPVSRLSATPVAVDARPKLTRGGGSQQAKQSQQAQAGEPQAKPKSLGGLTPPRSPEVSQSENRKPKTENAPCDTLAFDFMNLIVRAWHAGPPTESGAIRSMFQTVAQAVKALRPAHIVFALDGGHVHRSKLLPAYKAHRPEHDPNLKTQIALAEQVLKIAGINAIRVTNWEADDVLASLVERRPNIVICSSDKDLLALHGRCRIYHPWKSGEFADPETKLGIPAGQVTDYLAMCGDTSDGVPGIKGIGPKTAATLLQEYGSLESIIVAAKTGQIKGANGKKIAEQTAAALMCQEVIQLRASLPIPELQPWTPPAGYQLQLQSLNLGSIAALITAIHADITFYTPVRETWSAATPQAEPVERSSAGTRGFPADATATDHRREEATPPAEEHPRSNSTEDSKAGNGFVGQVVSTAGDGNFITRSITEPIRSGLSYDDRFNRPDAGMIAFWEAGRQCAGKGIDNPWRKGTPNHIAWQQGVEGFDLAVSLTGIPTPQAKPQPALTGSLF